MRRGEPVFVDSGAWIALAMSEDPLNPAAREHLDALQRSGAKLQTSIPVVIETFTFLDRNANRDVALSWKAAVCDSGDIRIQPCEPRDMEQAWQYFGRRDLHKLSIVDATSFAIMRRTRLQIAFTFDHHFAMAGFRSVA